MDPDAVHAVGRCAERNVVRIDGCGLVLVRAAHVVAVGLSVPERVAPTVPGIRPTVPGIRLARLVTRGPHRGECNDAPSRRDRGAGPCTGLEDALARWIRRLWTVPASLTAPEARDWVALTSLPLPAARALAWAATPRSGAVVSFTGLVRDHAEGREGVHAMTYEAYEEPALRAMRDVVGAARGRWPDVERIALWHRIGDLELSEPSVVVVVSSPHRADAFEAARYCIDTLKETVPIWKQEHWSDGSDWAVEQHPIRRVQPVGRVEAVGRVEERVE
jgi:molybdopterin synthase catalytic subunit